MNTGKENSTDTRGQQNNTKKDKADERAFNPFDKSQTTTARETLEEEAKTEQQRKETLTERD